MHEYLTSVSSMVILLFESNTTGTLGPEFDAILYVGFKVATAIHGMPPSPPNSLSALSIKAEQIDVLKKILEIKSPLKYNTIQLTFCLCCLETVTKKCKTGWLNLEQLVKSG